MSSLEETFTKEVSAKFEFMGQVMKVKLSNLSELVTLSQYVGADLVGIVSRREISGAPAFPMIMTTTTTSIPERELSYRVKGDFIDTWLSSLTTNTWEKYEVESLTIEQFMNPEEHIEYFV